MLFHCSKEQVSGLFLKFFFLLFFFVWLSNIKHVTPSLMAINECQIKARSALKAQSSNKRNGSSNVLFLFMSQSSTTISH